MSTEQQDFEELKRLLALKRHEQPPRRFFSQMTENIRDRLQQPQPNEQLTWWQRLRTDIDLKACALGVLACGLMLYAMLAAMGRPQQFLLPLEDSPQKQLPPSVPVVKSAPTLHPIPAAADIPLSTAPVMAPGQSNVPAQPASHQYWK